MSSTPPPGSLASTAIPAPSPLTVVAHGIPSYPADKMRAVLSFDPRSAPFLSSLPPLDSGSRRAGTIADTSIEAVLSKQIESFVVKLTARAWEFAALEHRSTLTRRDITMAITCYAADYSFMIDFLPLEDLFPGGPESIIESMEAAETAGADEAQPTTSTSDGRSGGGVGYTGAHSPPLTNQAASAAAAMTNSDASSISTANMALDDNEKSEC